MYFFNANYALVHHFVVIIINTVIPLLNLIHALRLIADSFSTTLTAVIELLIRIYGGSPKVDDLFSPLYCFRKEGLSIGPKYFIAWLNIFESLIK